MVYRRFPGMERSSTQLRFSLRRARTLAMMALKGAGHVPRPAVRYRLHTVTAFCANCGCIARAQNHGVVERPPLTRAQERGERRGRRSARGTVNYIEPLPPYN